ncbi:AraC family transcriptional regulator [Fibrella aquatilis]|uniref:AraC family transcriptional regulator ligand-binding domain-containing protein n=1 Tax=Fibrella aquatilis TaxID=2817059 RepID=A0A939G5Y2_9BACT|nr:AraC family transcriptional regulator [Fibrella aquatilis]MBO0931813.1 AraC family transcriptional regulator ligand-binding domain-containing protein [Fibrella aquatilis]
MNTTLSSLHLLMLLDYADCRGVSKSSLQALLDTPESELHDEQGRVSMDEYGRVWERLLQRIQDPHLGLHYGYFLNLKALGMMYQISLACSSIEQALGLLDGYLASTFPLVTISTKVGKDQFVIKLQSDVQNDLVRKQVLDSVLFLMYREISLMIEGDIAEVQLPYDTLDEYRRLCSSLVVQANTHGLIIDTRQVAGSINRRRLKNVELLLPAFLQLVNQPSPLHTPFSDQVKKMTLNLCSPELPGLDQVVAQFALSHRTFQRKLTEENTSFRAIADDIKRQLAQYLEQGRSLRTQDIAYVLGYSSASAYLHTAKKWRRQAAGSHSLR